MGEVGKDVADLPFHVIPVSLEQFQHFFDERLSLQALLYMCFVSSGDVRNDPAGFPPDYFLVVLENLFQGPQDIVFQELAGML